MKADEKSKRRDSAAVGGTSFIAMAKRLTPLASGFDRSKRTSSLLYAKSSKEKHASTQLKKKKVPGSRQHLRTSLGGEDSPAKSSLSESEDASELNDKSQESSLELPLAASTSASWIGGH